VKTTQLQHRIAAAAFSLLLSASVLHSEEQIKLTPVMTSLSSTTISGYVDTSAIYGPHGDYSESNEADATETPRSAVVQDVPEEPYFTDGASISLIVIGNGTAYHPQSDVVQQTGNVSVPITPRTFGPDLIPQTELSQTPVPEPSLATFAIVVGMLALPFLWRRRFQATAL
jgi:hypothetical protein